MCVGGGGWKRMQYDIKLDIAHFIQRVTYPMLHHGLMESQLKAPFNLFGPEHGPWEEWELQVLINLRCQ